MPENASTITQTIFSTINSLFSSLYSSVDNSIYGILDDLVFINTNIIQDDFISKILGTSVTSRFNSYSKFITSWFFTFLYCAICVFPLY